MTEAKHTPGPWIAIKCEIPGHTCWRAVSRDGHLSEKGEAGEANARLIAAAPELLEACKQAKKHLEPDLVEPGRTVFWDLVAAIAKATGSEAA